MQGEWHANLHAFVTAALGIYLLASAIQGWFFGAIAWPLRIVLLGSAIAMIGGGLQSDMIGLGAATSLFLIQKFVLLPRRG